MSVRVHVPVSEQSPFQPTKCQVASAGVAVSVTVGPGSKREVQDALMQDIPGGVLMTVPPMPTIAVRAIWAVSKMAVTVIGVVGVIVQGSMPEQALLQLRKLQPAAGVAVSAMGVLDGTVTLHEAEQLPPGLTVIVPDPLMISDSVSVLGGGGGVAIAFWILAPRLP